MHSPETSPSHFPLFGDKGGTRDKIILVKDSNIISDDTEVAEAFNDYFKNATEYLKIGENQVLTNPISHPKSDVEDAIKMFETHPSIISIKENVSVESQFYFSPVTTEQIQIEINKLNSGKVGTYMNIPTKQLKQVEGIVSRQLMNIWNEEVIKNKKFPTKLKLADISPIFKKLESIYPENYRPAPFIYSY